MPCMRRVRSSAPFATCAPAAPGAIADFIVRVHRAAKASAQARHWRGGKRVIARVVGLRGHIEVCAAPGSHAGPTSMVPVHHACEAPKLEAIKVRVRDVQAQMAPLAREARRLQSSVTSVGVGLGTVNRSGALMPEAGYRGKRRVGPARPACRRAGGRNCAVSVSECCRLRHRAWRCGSGPIHPPDPRADTLHRRP